MEIETNPRRDSWRYADRRTGQAGESTPRPLFAERLKTKAAQTQSSHGALRWSALPQVLLKTTICFHPQCGNGPNGLLCKMGKRSGA